MINPRLMRAMQRRLLYGVMDSDMLENSQPGWFNLSNDGTIRLVADPRLVRSRNHKSN
jgi:hypothetical protein